MILRLVLILLLLLPVTAYAADEYAEATAATLAQALVRFNAFDLKDDTILDEYMLITDCEIVQNYYDNDFQWSQVRGMVRDSIKVNIATFPTAFHYDTKLQLDRYDFKNKTFRFTAKTTVNAVNSYTFRLKNNYNCNGRGLAVFPTSYTMVTDSPVSIRGLGLSEGDAKGLLERLDADGNINRIIYTRFNLRITKISPLHKSEVKGEPESYVQEGSPAGNRSVRFEVRLDSVDFYEDEAMARLVYNYKQ